MDNDKMSKLIKQIIKFGIVGGIAAFIDFTVYFIVFTVLGYHYLIAGFFGFSISFIFNYFASMKFVFERQDGTSRAKEAIVFLVLSLIGLLINQMILLICMDGIYKNWMWLQGLFSKDVAGMLSKVAATGIVMIYNFISRKMFLEKKES